MSFRRKLNVAFSQLGDETRFAQIVDAAAILVSPHRAVAFDRTSCGRCRTLRNTTPTEGVDVVEKVKP